MKAIFASTLLFAITFNTFAQDVRKECPSLEGKYTCQGSDGEVFPFHITQKPNGEYQQYSPTKDEWNVTSFISDGVIRNKNKNTSNTSIVATC